SSTAPPHTSGVGSTAPTHDPHAPAEHVRVPALHAPTLLPQDSFAPSMQAHPSSTTPLQSSSIPLHASGCGPTAPVHAPHAPLAHVCVPARHAPTLLPQRRSVPLVHAHPSSTCPSQFSSSVPSHTSGEGPTAP